MANKSELPPDGPQIELKDPVVAGFLAWLIPGLGHFYQGRYAKGVLYMVCILGTFIYGLYLSSSQQTGPARAVYFSLRSGDLRLAYLCQVGAGLPALPALVQAVRVSNGNEPLWDGFMAPPLMESDRIDRPSHRTLADLNRQLPRFYELAGAYTMIAGLLNVLAIYDACCGPVAEPGTNDDEDEDAEEESPQ